MHRYAPLVILFLLAVVGAVLIWPGSPPEELQETAPEETAPEETALEEATLKEESQVPDEPEPLREAETYLEECSTWNDELADRSGRVHALILDVVKGKAQDAARARAEEEALHSLLGGKIESLERRPGPLLDEFQEYRKLLIEYLEWKRKAAHELSVRHIGIAEDRDVPPATRAQIVLEEAEALEEEELQWKERLGRLSKRLQDSIGPTAFGDEPPGE
jgi:hypothetical protein